MVPDKLTEWMGLPVKEWKPDDGPPEYSKYVYRIGFDWESEVMLNESLPKFLAGEGVEETIGLSLGADCEECSEFYEAAKLLIEHKEKLPKLKALYLAECDQEESEISWIGQGDISKFLEAFPGLEDFRARGCEGFTASPIRHICLKKLVIESGGLPSGVLAGIHGSILPELEHLELWLGTDEYGWDGEIDTVKQFLYDNPFPKLKYLGLRNSDLQNEIAEAAADAPVLDQLETLDLSLGVLKDSGGEALLSSEKVKQLRKLDLHRHFMSEEVTAKFASLGIEVDVSKREEPDDWDGELHYYVSVGE